MLPRHAASLLLALLLLAPGALAFSARHDAVELDYAATHAPVVLSAGALDLAGDLRDAVLAADVAPMTLKGVPTLHVDEAAGKETTLNAATLRVESGAVLWRIGDGRTVNVRAGAAYGFGLALTQAPLPSDNGTVGAGALLAGPDVEASADWAGAETQLVVLHGNVTLLRADGEPFAGWSHREVNANLSRPDESGNAGVLFRTEGAFAMTMHASVLAGAAGDSANLTLSVHRAAEDRFQDTLSVLSDLGSSLGMGGGDQGNQKGSPFQDGGPLQNLAPFSGLLNGALLVINNPDGNDTAAPLASRMGSDPFDVGPLSMMRSGDMRIAWSGDQMRVQGSPAVAINKAGFAVSPTASIAGVVPIVSVVLWVGALAAIVAFLVKRPPKAEKPAWSFRLIGWGVWLVVLLGVFLIWDASFADTFGTSVLTLLKSGSRDLQTLGIVFGLEMAPWSLAALLFALPVRIMLGIGLRYVGKGKALGSFAKAGGLVALAILGPIYALWIVNVAIQQAVGLLAGKLG